MQAEQKEKIAYSVQLPAKVWGTSDPRFIPADVRAALNPGPQVQPKNETNIILKSARFDLGGS